LDAGREAADAHRHLVRPVRPLSVVQHDGKPPLPRRVGRGVHRFADHRERFVTT
jgi:hypothetical protein